MYLFSACAADPFPEREGVLNPHGRGLPLLSPFSRDIRHSSSVAPLLAARKLVFAP